MSEQKPKVAKGVVAKTQDINEGTVVQTMPIRPNPSQPTNKNSSTRHQANGALVTQSLPVQAKPIKKDVTKKP